MFKIVVQSIQLSLCSLWSCGSLSCRWQRKWGVAHKCCQLQSLGRLSTQSPEALHILRGNHGNGIHEMKLDGSDVHKYLLSFLSFPKHRTHNSFYWPVRDECFRTCYVRNNGCSSSMDKGTAYGNLNFKKNIIANIYADRDGICLCLSMCMLSSLKDCQVTEACSSIQTGWRSASVTCWEGFRWSTSSGWVQLFLWRNTTVLSTLSTRDCYLSASPCTPAACKALQWPWKSKYSYTLGPAICLCIFFVYDLQLCEARSSEIESQGYQAWVVLMRRLYSLEKHNLKVTMKSSHRKNKFLYQIVGSANVFFPTLNQLFFSYNIIKEERK